MFYYIIMYELRTLKMLKVLKENCVVIFYEWILFLKSKVPSLAGSDSLRAA